MAKRQTYPEQISCLLYSWAYAVPQGPGPGLGKRLGKGAPQAYLEGTLSSHTNHPHSSQGCRTHLDPPFPRKSSPPADDAQPEWKVTSDQKHPLRITHKRTEDLADQPAPRNSGTPYVLPDEAAAAGPRQRRLGVIRQTGELCACPLVHQAFQKPPPRRRLLKGLVPDQTGTQLPGF
ncbi:hypothetical protein QTO34_016844 [Cnephaeus nilssonii]|uniref:Uncharacterized protein n=1 Tax=Cnephaeus nilssonii TaxID=3371016 RepID=A0AA40LQ50_CNENI|nr:hypothetical protein QTO34_016844 [Eptesicus nilssonii]